LGKVLASPFNSASIKGDFTNCRSAGVVSISFLCGGKKGKLLKGVSATNGFGLPILAFSHVNRAEFFIHDMQIMYKYCA
jgi:hypothetical protein